MIKDKIKTFYYKWKYRPNRRSPNFKFYKYNVGSFVFYKSQFVEILGIKVEKKIIGPELENNAIIGNAEVYYLIKSKSSLNGFLIDTYVREDELSEHIF